MDFMNLGNYSRSIRPILWDTGILLSRGCRQCHRLSGAIVITVHLDHRCGLRSSAQGFFETVNHTVDVSEIRLTTWDVSHTLVNNGTNLPTSTGERQISEPSTVGWMFLTEGWWCFTPIFPPENWTNGFSPKKNDGHLDNLSIYLKFRGVRLCYPIEWKKLKIGTLVKWLNGNPTKHCWAEFWELFLVFLCWNWL